MGVRELEGTPQLQLNRCDCRSTVPPPTLHPVDTAVSAAHLFTVSKKPHKVAESASSYAAKKPAKAAALSTRATSADDAAFKRITNKIFTERKELLRKLAQ